MYKGNERLRGTNEAVNCSPRVQMELARCSVDFEYWASNYGKIATLSKGIQLIDFYEYQKDMIRTITGIGKAENRDKKGMVVLAPRQCGKTTAIYLYLLWLVLFNKHHNIAIIANTAKNARKILRSMKQTYELLPLWMQAGLVDGGWSKSRIELANGSSVETGSATSDSIRGGSFHAVYLDEYAFIPPFVAIDFMKSVLPTILTGDNTRIFATSTPKGLNQFYHMWTKAFKGLGLFVPFRVRWQDVPRYKKKGFKELIVATEGIVFWNQEYECSFIGSSKTLLKSSVLEHSDPIDPIRKELDKKLDIWHEPDPRKKYMLGCDVGKGVGGDYSVIQVFDITNTKKLVQCARFRCNETGLNEFAQIIINVSKFYGEAEIMLENNEYGHIVANKIWDVFEYDKIINFEKEVIGVRSNPQTKAVANSSLREYTDNGWITIYDEHTWSELSTYEEIKLGIFGAIQGSHDDLVMALNWILFYLKSSDEVEEDVTDRKMNPRFTIRTAEQSKLADEQDEFTQLHSNPDSIEGGFLAQYESASADNDDLVGDWLDTF